MPDVTFTVDGKKLTAPAGTLLIEACKSAGIEIPAFCYYPGLSLQAACRMCVVRIEKMPKLQTACTTPVTEGMVVSTETPEIAQARKATIQLLLGNHPLDCPVCDAGGECELQDMTFKYGAATSFYTEPKNHRDEQQWSPVVFFDRPRCILCYRCVRMCGEGMDVFALGIQNRGSSSVIAPNVPAELSPDHHGARGLRAVRHVHRCLPGWRADLGHLSLQDAAVGDEPRRDDLHALRRRMQDDARRARGERGHGDHSRRQPRQERHQWRLPLQQGPLRVRFRKQRSSSDAADDSQGRQGQPTHAGFLGRGADVRGQQAARAARYARPAVAWRHRIEPHDERRELSAAEVRADGAGHEQHRPPPHGGLRYAGGGASGRFFRKPERPLRLAARCRECARDSAGRRRPDEPGAADRVEHSGECAAEQGAGLHCEHG